MKGYRQKMMRRSLPLYIMILPGILLVLIYHYIPMAGITMAFQNFIPAKGLFGGQTWVGLDNFKFAFQLKEMWRAVRNTVLISMGKIILSLVFPLIVSLMLNEIRKLAFKRTVQTIIYLPFFMSWVLLSVMMRDMLSTTGIFNAIISMLGGKPVFFLGDNKVFPWVLIISDTWKNFGYNTIIYLAALTSVDPTLYESAVMDGAGRWKQTTHITIPCISTTIVLLAVLSLGSIFNAGFDQIFNLYNPVVYESGDIIDTLVYRMGLINVQFSLSAAIGVMKSIVSCLLIAISYFLASRYANYRIF